MEYQPLATDQSYFEPTMDASPKKSPLATYILIGVLALVAVLSGFNYFFKPFKEYQPLVETAQVQQEEQNTAQVETENLGHAQEVAAAVAKLTPDEKIAQLIAIPIEAEDFLASISAVSSAQAENAVELEEKTSAAYVGFLSGEVADPDDFQSTGISEVFLKDWGFVTLFGANISEIQATQIISYIDDKNTLDVPVWIMVDHEGGTVQRLSGAGFTDLPSWQVQCASQITELLDPWKTSASELKKVGIDVVLAPVIDIAQNHPVLKTRVCSGDPAVIYEKSTAFITTFNEFDILPVLKHFPGIGTTQRDLHQAFDAVTADQASVDLYHSLLEVYPYSAVMTSHVGITNQDATVPCSLSSECVGQLTEVYPQVLVISDALEMKSTGVDNSEVYLEDVALEAVVAGNDVLLFGEGVSQSDLKIVHDRLLREYNNSFEFRELVNDHVTRILDYKMAK